MALILSPTYLGVQRVQYQRDTHKVVRAVSGQVILELADVGVHLRQGNQASKEEYERLEYGMELSVEWT